MKKLFLIPSAALSVLGTVSAFAQDAAAATETVVAETQIAGDSMHHVMMQKFLEGGWEWMLPVLLYGNRRRYDRGVRRHPGCR